LLTQRKLLYHKQTEMSIPF